MSNPIETLCAHAGRSLPDSLRERKTVLRAMEKVLMPGHPVQIEVQAQLAGIAAVERLEVQLKLGFLTTKYTKHTK